MGARSEGYRGDFATGTNIKWTFTTAAAAENPAALTSGALSVYKDNSTTQSTTGVTFTGGFDSVTGLNLVEIDTSSDGTFYSSGSYFNVVVTTGTISSVSAVGSVIGSFTLNKVSALRPTTAGSTLDVTATGAAGIDWGNVENKTTTNALTGTTVAATQQVDVNTIKTQAVTCAAGVTVLASVGGDSAPGTSGGILISGTNAGTVTFGAMTVTGATIHTGNVSMAAGLTLTQSTTNGHGLSVTGNGTGHAFNLASGATGRGISVSSTGASLYLASSGNFGVNIQSGSAGINIGSAGASFSCDNTFDIGAAMTVTGGITANIAGTITNATNVTNLTNAATAGDFTATMKTSLNASTPAATIGTGGITSSTFAAGAINAAAIATDAIGADEISAAAVAKIQAGLSTYAGGDTSGTTTLLTRLPSAITLTAGAVTVGTNNDKAGYSISGTTTTLDALQTAQNSAHGAGSWATATGFAVPGDIPTASQVADTTLRRTMANAEGSAFGDTLNKSSLYGLVQMAQESNSTDNVGSLTIYKTDGTTQLGLLSLSTDAAADPITGVS